MGRAGIKPPCIARFARLDDVARRGRHALGSTGLIERTSRHVLSGGVSTGVSTRSHGADQRLIGVDHAAGLPSPGEVVGATRPPPRLRVYRPLLNDPARCWALPFRDADRNAELCGSRPSVSTKPSRVLRSGRRASPRA